MKGQTLRPIGGTFKMNALMNIMIRLRAASAQAEVNKLKREIAQLEAQLKTARVSSNNMFGGASLQAINNWGSRVQWAGRQLTANFTMPLGLAGTAATKWWMDSESAMVRVRKVYGDASSDLTDAMENKLGQAFDLLSVKYAVNAAETRNIAGEWAAAGATGTALAKAVEQTMKVMVLGEMSAAEATEALISIQAQYGANTEELTRIINNLNATENATGITFKGLIQGFSRSASTARDAGVDIEHLSAMLAALTPSSGTATQSGNALKTMISRLLSPTKDAKEVLGLMGIQMDDIGWKSLDGAQRLQVLAEAYHNLEGSGEGFVSSQAAVVSSVVASRYQINRFSTLMRDVYTKMDDNAKTNGYYGKTLGILADQSRVARMAQKELNTVLKSSPISMKRAGVMIQNSFIKIINNVMPQILTFVNMIAKLSEKFANLDPVLQKIILGFLAFLAVLGPPLSLLGASAVAFSQIAMMLGKLSAPLKIIGGLFRGVGAASAAGSAAAAASSATVAASSAATAKVVAASSGSQVASQARISIATAKAAKKTFASGGSTISTFKRVMGGAQVMATKVQANLGMMGIAAQTQFGRMSYGAQVHLTKTMPTAAARGMAAINNQVFKGGMLMTTIMSRSLFDNLTAMSFYVDAAVGKLQSGLARMQAAGTVATGAMATKIASSRAGGAALGAAAAGGGAATTAGAATGAASAAAAAKGMRKAQAAVTAAGPKIMGTIKSWGPKIMATVKAWGPKLLKFFTGPWGIALTAVTTLFMVFGKQIGQVFDNIKRMVQDSTSPFGRAWAGVVGLFNKGVGAIHKAFGTLPKGIQGALSAVVKMVSTAAKKVYELFSYINPWARHSPSLVENVTSGMDRVGKIFGLSVGSIRKHMRSGYAELSRFGKAVAGFMKRYERMKHNDNIELIGATAGKKAVGAYNALRKTLGPLQKDLEKIGAAMQKQQIKVDKLAANLKKLQAAADAAQAELDALASEADGLSDSIDAANSEIDRYASMGITGMKAMSDQIFENEMAQKKLRLEMLKMNDVDVDKLRDKLAGIQGDIDNLRGEQADLRASGAGSDILGTYDAMIAELEGQQKVINKSVAPYNELEKQLADLEKQGEILDLENSIKFDPLTRQIEDLASGYEELPFAKIVSGINEQKRVIDELTPKLSNVNQEIKDQQVLVDAANAAVDEANKKYEAEVEKLDILQRAYAGVEEEIRAIENAMNDLVEAASAMQTAMEEAQRAKDKTLSPGAENFLDAAGGSYEDPGGFNVIGDELGGSIDEYIDQLTQDVAGLLGNIDILGPIKNAWAKVTQWWSSNITPIWNDFAQGVKDAFDGVDFTAPFKKIGDWFNNSPIGKTVAAFAGRIWENIKGLGQAVVDALAPMIEPIRDSIKPLLESLGRLFTKVIWPAVKKVAKIIAGALGAALFQLVNGFNLVVNILKNVVGPIFRAIGDVVSGLIKIITGMVTTVVKLFSGDFKGAWNSIVATAKAALGALWGALRGVGGTLWGILKGAIESVGDLLKSMWDGFGKDLVQGLKDGVTTAASNIGNWIVKNVVDPVVNFFKKALGINSPSTVFLDFGKDLIQGLYNGIMSLIGKVLGWAKGLGGDIVKAVGSLLTTLKQKGIDLLTGVYNGITQKWTSVKTWFGDMKNKVTSAVGSTVSTLKQKGTDFLVGVSTGATEKWNSVKTWFGDMRNKVTTAVGSTVSTLKQKGTDFLTGVRDGATSRWESVKGWFGGMKSRVTSAVGSTVSTLKQKGTDFLSGVKNGATSRWESVRTWFGGLGGRVKNSIGNVGSLLFGIGKSIINGLWNGMKNMWDNGPASWLSGLGNKIKNLKGPERVDKVLLVNEGKWIMGGFGKGLKEGYRPVEKMLGGITGEILSDVNAAMRYLDSSMTGVAGVVADSMASGVTSAMSATATMGNAGDEKTYNFYGNLEFPNISDPNDAKDFLSNLELAAGGATR